MPDDELVTLDRLGTVPTPTLSGLVVAPGLPEASRTRLAALGDQSGSLEITEDLDRAGQARLVILSTRLPRAELTTMAGRLIEDTTCPVFALAHAGGESLAVEVVRRGGLGVIAEVNETSVASLLTGESDGELGLLDSYDRQIARTDTAPHGTRGRDVVTGLPDGSSLEARLGTLEQDGEVPRLAAVRIVRTPLVPEELGEDAAQLIRRRLATQFRHVARSYDADIFAVAPWEFTLVAMSLSPNAIQYLGRDLDRIAETYSPTGVTPLGVALGHAGAEVTPDVTEHPIARKLCRAATPLRLHHRAALVVLVLALEVFLGHLHLVLGRATVERVVGPGQHGRDHDAPDQQRPHDPRSDGEPVVERAHPTELVGQGGQWRPHDGHEQPQLERGAHQLPRGRGWLELL